MKDALGHGSNGRGQYLTPSGRSIIPSRPARGGSEYPARGDSSDAAAAEALRSIKYSTAPVLTHPAMQDRYSGNNADYTTAENNAVSKSSFNAQAGNALMAALRKTMQR